MTNQEIKELIAQKEKEIKELKTQLKRETFLVKATCEKIYTRDFVYNGSRQGRKSVEIKRYFKTKEEALKTIERIKEEWSKRKLEHICGYHKHYTTCENIIIKLDNLVVYTR